MKRRHATALLLLLAAGCTSSGEGEVLWKTAPDESSHERYFPIASGPHAVDCNACHGAFDSFRSYDCLTCHERPRADGTHSGLAGYAYESAACYRCHPTGKADSLSPSEHARYFPIGPGTRHAEAGCAQCHADASNRKVVDCTSCHAERATAPQHERVGGYAWHADATATSGRCLRCHADAQVDRVSVHEPFAITEASKHWKSDCLTCHAGSRVDKPWGADFETHDCTACHLEAKDRIDSRHTGIPAYAADSASCLVCHPTGGEADVDHARYFPIEPASSHAEASCGDCHVAATNRSAIDCTGACHTQEGTTPVHDAVGGFAWKSTPLATSALCLKCHAESQVHAVADHTEFGIAETTRHWRSSCLECHPTPRVDKPWGEDFSKNDCTTCHVEAKDRIASRHAGIAGFSADSASCLLCHPTGGPGGVDHAPIFPIGAGTRHETARCVDCHVDSTNRKAVDCTGSCHVQATMTTKHSLVGGYRWQSTALATSSLCLRCHADSQVDRVAAHLPFRIVRSSAGDAEHQRESCLVCHPTTRTDKPFGQDFQKADCSGCHSRREMDDKHQSMARYQYATATCLECHADGDKP